MSDYSISAECHLRRLSVDLQLLQHAFVRVSSGPGQALAFSVGFEDVDALGRVGADYVEGYPVIVAVANFLFDTPQLDATCPSPSSVKIDESRFAFANELC